MVRINLLPVREIKRRLRAKNQLIGLGIVFFCILLALGLLAYMQLATKNQLKRELADLKREKSRYAKIIKEIKKLEEDKAVIETQISIIRKLKQDSSLTVHILDEVANLIPSQRMWLTELTQNGSHLKLSGMALDNRTIAQFMDDLKRSPYVRSVNLANVSMKKYAGRNLKSFSLSCSIGMPEKKQPDGK